MKRPRGRPKGTTDMTPAERRRIRSLFRQGVRFAEIAQLTGRSERAIRNATKGLKRKRPSPPSGKHTNRNDHILTLVERGMTRAEIGELMGLSPTQVSTIVREHPHIAWLLRKQLARPADVARRYRMEVSTARRIAAGPDAPAIPRSRDGGWGGKPGLLG